MVAVILDFIIVFRIAEYYTEAVRMLGHHRNAGHMKTMACTTMFFEKPGKALAQAAHVIHDRFGGGARLLDPQSVRGVGAIVFPSSAFCSAMTGMQATGKRWPAPRCSSRGQRRFFSASRACN
jgi:hypothetical protein